MKVFLIRHTKVGIEPGICYGTSDVPLADTYTEDTSDIIRQLSHIINPVVYSSPLKRCRILAEQISPNIIYDCRLQELNFGDWELQSWDTIKGPEADRWMNDFVNVRCPGGESYIDLCIRVKSFLSDLQKKQHDPVIIVTHGGVVRSILALVQGVPPEKSFDIKVEYGQISEVFLPSIL